MKRVAIYATVIAIFVGIGGWVSADSRVINFEISQGYHIGSIDNQPAPPPAGWGGQSPPGIPINPLIDQEVVANVGAPPSFGGQSWRISNAYTSGSFGDMPFSPSLANEAGETMAKNGNGVFTFSGGTRQNHFEAQWSFTSADPGPGTDCATTGITCSYLSMAPDRGDGARMSYIRLEDDTTGLRVFFDDYQDAYPYGAYGNPTTAAQGCGTGDDFVETMIASNLDRRRAHTVKLTMDFVDGPRNDVVKVFVDGTLRHTGTSWEDYFRWCTESGGGTGTTANDQSRTVDSMIFTVRGGQGETHPLNRRKGFLIDNLSYSSSLSGHECDDHHADGNGDVDDGHGGHGQVHFHKQGCDKRDDDDVEHDDGQHGHHFRSTSVDTAQFNTLDGGRSVAMTGIGLDNGLPVGFTLIAIDYDGVLPASYQIILTNGYAFAGEFVSGSTSVQ